MNILKRFFPYIVTFLVGLFAVSAMRLAQIELTKSTLSGDGIWHHAAGAVLALPAPTPSFEPPPAASGMQVLRAQLPVDFDAGVIRRMPLDINPIACPVSLDQIKAGALVPIDGATCITPDGKRVYFIIERQAK